MFHLSSVVLTLKCVIDLVTKISHFLLMMQGYETSLSIFIYLGNKNNELIKLKKDLERCFIIHSF